jgi:hypothetical protein
VYCLEKSDDGTMLLGIEKPANVMKYQQNSIRLSPLLQAMFNIMRKLTPALVMGADLA